MKVFVSGDVLCFGLEEGDFKLTRDFEIDC